MFLTSDPSIAPIALMHNLKHNRVLHEENLILSVITADTPRIADDARVRVQDLSPDFKQLTITYGFMETPDIPGALARARLGGLKFNVMATSFFLGRRSVVAAARHGLSLWQDRLFIYLMRNAENPTDYFHIPPTRVVEMGAQVSV